MKTSPSKSVIVSGDRSICSRISAAALTLLTVLSQAGAETVAYWRFEEATSGEVPAHATAGGSVPNTLLDASGYGNHMQTWTTATAPAYTAQLAPPAGTLAGVAGTGALNTASLDFNGKPEDVYTGNKPINTKQFQAWTVEASFQLDVAGSWQVIVGKDGNPVGGQSPLSLKVRADNKLEIGVVDGSGVARSVVGTTRIKAGVWYHAVATATSDTLSLWLKPADANNFISQGSTSISGAFFNSYSAFNQPWIIGRGMWNGKQADWINGRIDEVRISDVALDSTDFLGNFSPVDSDEDGLPDAWELIYFRENAAESDATILAKQSSPSADPDGDGYSNEVELRLGLNPANADDLTGKLTREVWFGINGGKVTDLTRNSRFYDEPDLLSLNDGTVSPVDFDDSFGERLRGWVTPEVSGDYTFWISGDDQCELWLSSTASKFDRQLIANASAWTAPQQWTKFASQKSVTIPLVAGQSYFIEILHKEEVLADSVAVAWTPPGGALELLPAAVLSPYLSDPEDTDMDELPDSWELAQGFDVGDRGVLYPEQRADADPDGDGFNNLLEALSNGDPYAAGGNIGYVRRDIWAGIDGETVANLTSSPKFVQAPNSSTYVYGNLEFGAYGDRYGQKLSGALVPPLSGYWRFSIASDDSSELWLSSTTSATNKQKVAWVAGYTGVGNYDVFPTQKSGWIHLDSSSAYYFEVLHKEHLHADHVSVVWEYQPFNWALAANGSTATQSSTYGGLGADRAIDGNTDGNPAVPTATHTQNLANSWWQVDFGQDRPVNRVVLFNRTDSNAIQNQERLSNFRISVLDAAGNELVGQDFFTTSGYVQKSMAWDLPELVNARKIKVQILGHNLKGNGFLCLAEVQAFDWITENNRRVVDAQSIRTLGDDPLDQDGDGLPDAWELAMGLDPADNGSTDPANGAYGDPDGDLLTNLDEYLLGLDPLEPSRAPGQFLVERWNNIPGYGVDELVSSNAFHGAADSRKLTAPSELKFSGTYFGSRARGYITPQVTGDYTFWISARNGAEFWLSDDLGHGKYAKRLIASIDVKTGGGHGIGSNESNLWDRFSTQRGEPVHLEAGQSYYVEILHQNGHVGHAHASLAWARDDGPRETLPDSVVSSYVKTPDDQDDDCLPDAWETLHGLDVTDNGLVDRARQGERGDFDSDGLTNREEYLLGTSPALADTDGDGVSDFDEIHHYGTSPTESNAITGAEVPAPGLTDYNAGNTTADWQIFDGGLIANSFRGRIEWSFTVPSDGWWVIELGARLRGTLRDTEDVDLGIRIDDKALAPHQMRFLHGRASGLKVITPYLTAGTHTFELDIRNEIGRRTLQVLSLKVLGAGGYDGDDNGRPDWLDNLLAGTNSLAPVPSESVVSPLFIEGGARYSGAISASASAQTVGIQRGLGDLHWFGNLPLEPSGVTPVNVVLEDRTEELEVEWVRWNALGGIPLTVRAGDSVKIGAWLAQPDEADVSITVDGQTETLTADGFFVKTFSQAGVYPLTVVHDGAPQAAVSITVVSADFGTPAVFYADMMTWRSFSGVPSALVIAGEPSIKVDASQPEGSGQKVLLRPFRSGSHTLAARLPGGGPIVALGEVSTLGISEALRNDAAVYIGSTADGYRILRTPIVVTDLPPGGRVVLTIFRAGVTFLDGTTVKELTAEDFLNGVAYIEFRYPPGMAGGYCHYTDVYDAENRHLGRR